MWLQFFISKPTTPDRPLNVKSRRGNFPMLKNTTQTAFPFGPGFNLWVVLGATGLHWETISQRSGDWWLSLRFLSWVGGGGGFFPFDASAPSSRWFVSIASSGGRAWRLPGGGRQRLPHCVRGVHFGSRSLAWLVSSIDQSKHRYHWSCPRGLEFARMP